MPQSFRVGVSPGFANAIAITIACGLLVACGNPSQDESASARSQSPVTLRPGPLRVPATDAVPAPVTSLLGADRVAPQAGGLNGTQWADLMNTGERLTGIRVCLGGAGTLVASIQLFTDQRVFPPHGSTAEPCTQITLANGEKLRQIFGHAGASVDSIGFRTTAPSGNREYGPYGNNTGTGGSAGSAPYVGTVAEGLDFVGFYGRSSSILTQINFVNPHTGVVDTPVFYDKLRDGERVTAVIVCHGQFVYAVRLETDQRGLLAKRGGEGPQQQTCTRSALQAGEFIQEVNGGSGSLVDRISFKLNSGRVIGPFGGPGGNPFNYTIPGPTFVGWWGTAGWYLHRIGFMSPPLGNNANDPLFVDYPQNFERISRIRVCTSTVTWQGASFPVVGSIQLTTPSGLLPKRGGRDGRDTSCVDTDLAQGEFVTEIFGGAGSLVDRIGFRMNTGRVVGPWGGGGGDTFTIQNPNVNRFLGFTGRAWNVIGLIDFALPDIYLPKDPPNGTAQNVGYWGPVTPWPVLPAHAVVLPNGLVLTYGSDLYGNQGAQFNYSVWDPALGTGEAAHQVVPNATGTDLFCTAQSVLPQNGRVLLAGGDRRQQGEFNGAVQDVNVFDPGTRGLTRVASLRRPRWYGTQTMLPDGRVLTTAGLGTIEWKKYDPDARDASGNVLCDPNKQYAGLCWTFPTFVDGWEIEGEKIAITTVDTTTPEIYDVGTGTWSDLSGAGPDNPVAREAFQPVDAAWYYPRQYVGKDGRVYFHSGRNTKIFALNATGSGSVVDTGARLPFSANWHLPTAMYQPGKLISALEQGRMAHIDLDTNPPTVTQMAPLSQPRYWANMTILPTGEVLVTGGSSVENRTGVAYHAELWNPATRTFTRLASEERSRLYHSLALLLPDGRVLSAGGGAPGPELNLNAQIFSPPYLFRKDGSGAPATRPAATNVPAASGYNAAFTVTTDVAPTSIARVTLVRMSSVTHSFNMDQRFNELSITARNPTERTLTVMSPPNANHAPPGYYLLFVIDTAGVPSVGKVIRIS